MGEVCGGVVRQGAATLTLPPVDGVAGLDVGGGLTAFVCALDNNDNLIRKVKPDFIVMYDPDLAFLREVEVSVRS